MFCSFTKTEIKFVIIKLDKLPKLYMLLIFVSIKKYQKENGVL